MKSTTLTKIITQSNKVDGSKEKIVGIFFYFKDRIEPISYGTTGTFYLYTAEFNES